MTYIHIYIYISPFLLLPIPGTSHPVNVAFSMGSTRVIAGARRRDVQRPAVYAQSVDACASGAYAHERSVYVLAASFNCSLKPYVVYHRL